MSTTKRTRDTKKMTKTTIWYYISSIVLSLENNKLIAGLLILFVNIGTKYVALDFSKTQEEYMRAIFSRQLLIFAMVWTATRDLIISILVTAAFIILSDFVINPESKLCMLPDKYKQMHQLEIQGKLKNEELVTSQDIKKAEEILKRAQRQNMYLSKYQ